MCGPAARRHRIFDSRAIQHTPPGEKERSSSNKFSLHSNYINRPPMKQTPCTGPTNTSLVTSSIGALLVEVRFKRNTHNNSALVVRPPLPTGWPVTRSSGKSRAAGSRRASLCRSIFFMTQDMVFPCKYPRYWRKLHFGLNLQPTSRGFSVSSLAHSILATFYMVSLSSVPRLETSPVSETVRGRIPHGVHQGFGRTARNVKSEKGDRRVNNQ